MTVEVYVEKDEAFVTVEVYVGCDEENIVSQMEVRRKVCEGRRLHDFELYRLVWGIEEATEVEVHYWIAVAQLDVRTSLGGIPTMENCHGT